MKDKNGNKRKLSIRYICWLIGSLIMIIAFFLIMVFSYHIFDDYRTAEIIKINGVTDKDINFTSGRLEIVFLVDGEEFTAYYQEPIKSRLKIKIKVGDKIQYLAKNPNKIQLDRMKGIAILSCVEVAIVALLIGTTIYEVKKICKNRIGKEKNNEIT